MVLVDRYYADFATRRRPDLDRKLQISLRHKSLGIFRLRSYHSGCLKGIYLS
jgi:hypothetical protein